MRRRGAILIAVMIAVTLGALMASSILFMVRAEQSGAESTLDGLQSRSIAWSAIQAAAGELAAQRDDLLLGRDPDISESWVLYDDGDRRGVARIVSRHGAALHSETAKIDINHATEDMLAAVPGLDAEVVSAIISRRDEAPYQSVESLLAIDGVTPQVFYGESRGWATEDGFDGGIAGPPALIDLLTVHSFEPNVQAGFDSDGRQHRGNRRINLNQSWSDALGRELTKRFDEATSEGIRQIMAQGTTFESNADLARLLLRFDIDPSDWVIPFDAVATDPRPYLHGLVDMNRAPEDVLSCLPGLTTESAESIAATRDALDDDVRVSVVWPVLEDVIEPSAFPDLVDHVTTRSLQWRFRIESGIESIDASQVGDLRSGTLESIELEDRVVFDVIIDLAGPQPRIAYLRDVTLAPLAERLAATIEAESDQFTVEPGLYESGDFDELADENRSDDPTSVDWERDEWTRDDWSREEWSRDDWERESWTRDAASPSSATDAPRREAIPDSNVDSRIGRWTTGKRANEQTESDEAGGR